MNKDTIKGEWKQLKGKVKAKWGQLTDDEVSMLDGSYEQLVGKIQERYGAAREDVEQEVKQWLDENSQDNKNTSTCSTCA